MSALPAQIVGPETPAEDLRNALAIMSLVQKLPNGMGYRLSQIDADALVARLWKAIRKLEAHRCELPASIQEALNSGDGVYRP